MNAPNPVPDNMLIWEAVSKTDPRNTKRVNQRGGFTAINAHSQVMEATRQFGPIGQGWGFVTSNPIRMDELVIVPVTLWHGEVSNQFGPIFGAAELHDSKGRLDSDAPKKATTDGLTKGLSLLGFNADVFLGLYDDNKYVQQVAAEFAQAEQEAEQHKEPAARQKLEGPHSSKTALRKAVHDLIAEVRRAQSLDALKGLIRDHRATLAQAQKDWPNLISGDPDIAEDQGFDGAYAERRAELDPDTMVNRAIRDMHENCRDVDALASWRDTNSAYLEQLDGAESRRFQSAYDEYEAGLSRAEEAAGMVASG